jgi:hypothetical protein
MRPSELECFLLVNGDQVSKELCAISLISVHDADMRVLGQFLYFPDLGGARNLEHKTA